VAAMLMSEDYDNWLGAASLAAEFKALLRSYDVDLMEAYAVSRVQCRSVLCADHIFSPHVQEIIHQPVVISFCTNKQKSSFLAFAYAQATKIPANFVLHFRQRTRDIEGPEQSPLCAKATDPTGRLRTTPGAIVRATIAGLTPTKRTADL
jgi:hypothetical protein